MTRSAPGILNLARSPAEGDRGFGEQIVTRLEVVLYRRSHAEVGRRTGFGCEAVRRYRNGRVPPLEFLSEVAAAYGIRMDWLLLGRGPMGVEDVELRSLLGARPTDLTAAIARRLAGDLEGRGHTGARRPGRPSGRKPAFVGHAR